MARVPPEPTKCFFTVKVRYVTMGVQNLSISLLDSSISPLQDTIRPSRRPPYSSLYRTLPGKRMVHEASQMGVLSLLKVEFDGDSTVLLPDEVHLAI